MIVLYTIHFLAAYINTQHLHVYIVYIVYSIYKRVDHCSINKNRRHCHTKLSTVCWPVVGLNTQIAFAHRSVVLVGCWAVAFIYGSRRLRAMLTQSPPPCVFIYYIHLQTTAKQQPNTRHETTGTTRFRVCPPPPPPPHTLRRSPHKHDNGRSLNTPRFGHRGGCIV